MYVSRPVRAIRDEPVPGESVTLLLRLTADAEPGAVAAAVQELGGTIERELQFGDLEVTVAHVAVAEVCELDGLEAVETDSVHVIDLDGAGEDVDY